MRRRMLLAAALFAPVTACTGPRRAGPRPSGGTAPTGGASATGPNPGAVALWRLSGGFVGPGVTGLRPPRLAVYPDRRAIADARYTGDLTAAELTDLVNRLTQDLRDPAAASKRPGTPTVADAPDTVLTVRSAAGEFTVTALGLQELRDEQAYPATLYDARDRLDAIYTRVVNGDRRYTASRVRLVAIPVGQPDTDGAVRPWPAAVPVPPGTDANVRSADLAGGAAQAVAALLEQDWHTYRTADGTLLSAAWRYLLPDE